MTATHRHTTHEHEHEFEAAPGLPEPLPQGERILWQGAPDWRALARECFHVRKLAIYFALLVLLRIVTYPQGADWTTHVAPVAVFVALACGALAIVAALAWLSARTALYTITDRRIVMRIGIVLSVTFNLPFKRVEGAALHPLAKDHGDIALALDRSSHIAYLHLWPHARPWKVAHPQPSLRCLPEAARVATLLTEAWRAARSDDVPMIAERIEPVRAPVATTRPSSRNPLAAEPAAMA